MAQSYQQRLTERRLTVLLFLITVLLFALKFWQESNLQTTPAPLPQQTTQEQPRKTAGPPTATPRPTLANGQPKKKVAVATYIHKGNYDRAFAGYADGMLDNLAVITSQVHRFAPVMQFDVELLVFLDNTTSDMEPVFQRLGWHVRHLQVAVSYEDVRNKQIAHELHTDGAIAIWEMLKLEAWRPSIVKLDVELIALIDTDIHIRQPFDSIFLPPAMSETATLGFTQGAWEGEKVNGGFLVIRPDARSEQDYHNILELLKEGDFRPGSGWKGKVGWTYGGRTIQGLLPYYYLHGEGVGRGSNMSRCTYNNMVNSNICKGVAAKDVISNHFTGGCMKPWSCRGAGHALCNQFTDQWWDDVKLAEEWFKLPHRRRCPGGQYESMGIKREAVTRPPA
eukprot:TRINITY_DN1320_c3_g2_i1.p1 TRINITY_DN1320_c3_g2~~TRINITY_DN1320_c3_g2_i1.p1  ORF type:complete len:405 (+),score=134.62 TRINITY_DN1320_c3_g2_i1:34-1215(+)